MMSEEDLVVTESDLLQNMSTYVGMWLGSDKVDATLSMAEHPTATTAMAEDGKYFVVLPKRESKDYVYRSITEYLAMITGLADHEIGHILYSDMTIRVKNDLKKHLLNMLEDARVEWKVSQLAPLSKDWLDYLNIKMYNLEHPPVFDQFTLKHLLASLIHRTVLCLDPDIRNDDLRKVLDEIYPVVSMVYYDDSTRDVYKRVEKVYKIIKKYFPDADQDYDQSMPGTMSLPSSSQSGGRGEQQNKNQGDSQGEQRPNEDKIDDLISTSMIVSDSHDESQYPPKEDQKSMLDSLNEESDSEPKTIDSGKDQHYDILKEEAASIIHGDIKDRIMDYQAESLKGVPAKVAANIAVKGVNVINLSTQNRNKLTYHHHPRNLVTDEYDFIKKARSILEKTLHYLAERHKYKLYGKRGRLNTKRLHRVKTSPQRNPKLYVRKISQTKVNIAIDILLDASGSMRSDYESLFKMALSLEEVLRDFRGINFAIHAYNKSQRDANKKKKDVDWMNIYIVKPYYRIPPSLLSTNLLKLRSRTFPDGGTPTGNAIRFVSYELDRCFPDVDAKMIFVITDGKPSSPTDAKRAIMRSASHIYGIYYSNEASMLRGNLERLFGDNLSVAHTYSDVVQDITKKLENFLKETYDTNAG